MTEKFQTQKPLNVTDANSNKKSNNFLRPPTPTRQYLISPPASPPVGWTPCEENTPVLNYDLIHAINSLAPGESHELHPPSEDKPAIVVHICEDDAQTSSSQDQDEQSEAKLGKVKILPTRMPERNCDQASSDK